MCRLPQGPSANRKNSRLKPFLFNNISFQGRYCSDECQKGGWAEHKKECKEMRRERKKRKEEKKKDKIRQEEQREEEKKENSQTGAECRSKMETFESTEVD